VSWYRSTLFQEPVSLPELPFLIASLLAPVDHMYEIRPGALRMAVPTAEQIEHHIRLAAFEQNHLSFRSLNQQMWQIPLISMTLTGGLWFGVSRVEDFPLFQFALLFLAAAGNAALFIVIHRLRYVMERYLNWLENKYPPGFVSAHGDRWYHKSFVVRTSIQVTCSPEMSSI